MARRKPNPRPVAEDTVRRIEGAIARLRADPIALVHAVEAILTDADEAAIVDEFDPWQVAKFVAWTIVLGAVFAVSALFYNATDNELYQKGILMVVGSAIGTPLGIAAKGAYTSREKGLCRHYFYRRRHILQLV